MYPKEAWKFKLWTDAMLRGATVGAPEYKGKSTGSKHSSGMRINRRFRKKRRRRAKKKEG